MTKTNDFPKNVRCRIVEKPRGEIIFQLVIMSGMMSGSVSICLGAIMVLLGWDNRLIFGIGGGIFGAMFLESLINRLRVEKLKGYEKKKVVVWEVEE